MIAYVNSTLGGADLLTCVTRPHRFGKSISTNMLCAYYDKFCDSSALFDGFKIASDTSYREHLNKYLVIYLDITNFVTEYQWDVNIVKYMQDDSMRACWSIYDWYSAYQEIWNGVRDTLESLIQGNPVRMN